MEADFLDPTHNKQVTPNNECSAYILYGDYCRVLLCNKQDFNDNTTWRRMFSSLSEKLNMYWNEVRKLTFLSSKMTFLNISQFETDISQF